MSNVHAWFANVSAQNSAGWVAEFFQQNNVAAADVLSNRPAMYIAETGWPTVHQNFVLSSSEILTRASSNHRMCRTRVMAHQQLPKPIFRWDREIFYARLCSSTWL